MKKKQSLRTKATNFVSVLLNPISDPDSHQPSKHPPTSSEGVGELKKSDEEGNNSNLDLVDNGPDTSSFTAFLYSLLSSSDSKENDNSNGHNDDKAEPDNNNHNSPLVDSSIEENGGRKSLFSRSKQSVGRVIRRAVRIRGFRHHDRKDSSNNVEVKLEDRRKESLPIKESLPLDDFPGISEPSVLVSESIRNVLYASLPPLMHGRKWLLLYSTWRNGISLSTLYRRSMLWPGLSLLVVGDKKGAVFGSLVETPLKPSNKRKYQGTNSTYVFTNISGHPFIYRPTGVNRYFTLCNTDYIAIGGGGHFALYLDGDLLNGSSSVSETFGNPCLANSQDFEVKEVELWGFVQTSRYEEMLALSRTEVPGICRW
ncbi:oxidation resistance protein 1-like [Trifolium pratense]|uniref:oxidation resistance protein 1-like n=1 Tax=Trifolium pratense TaxID=57577 RepID=UPI001E693558|nr:oxidation resistance protein 1-like [Trifolium pratense]